MRPRRSRRRVIRRQLDHDDLGAKIRQEGGGRRTGEPLRQIKDAQTVERPVHEGSPASRGPSRRGCVVIVSRLARTALCARQASGHPAAGVPACAKISAQALGRETSCPVCDCSVRKAWRACTCSSAMISSTERIAVPATPTAKKRASTSARSCGAIQALTTSSIACAMLRARGHGGETRVVRRLGRLNRLAEPNKRLVASAGQGDPSAVSGRVNVGRDDSPDSACQTARRPCRSDRTGRPHLPAYAGRSGRAPGRRPARSRSGARGRSPSAGRSRRGRRSS